MNLSFETILGHEKQKRMLQKMKEKNRLPHALLFLGEKGIGKRLFAQTLAASLLCQKNQTQLEPCGACASCFAFAHQTHPDFFCIEPEQTGKTSRSIKLEKILDLQQKIAPMTKISSRRVVLIDDLQTMNDIAANAFLKTLEEPRGETIFLLIANASLSSLLTTIVSRCLVIPFAPLQFHEMEPFLQKKFPEQADNFQTAFNLSNGSISEALRLFEEHSFQIQTEAETLLKNLPRMTTCEIFRQAKHFSEDYSRETLEEFIKILRFLIHERLKQSLQKNFSSQSELENEFCLENFVTELQKRIFTSNASARVQLEGFFFRAKDYLS